MGCRNGASRAAILHAHPVTKPSLPHAAADRSGIVFLRPTCYDSVRCWESMRRIVQTGLVMLNVPQNRFFSIDNTISRLIFFCATIHSKPLEIQNAPPGRSA